MLVTLIKKLSGWRSYQPWAYRNLSIWRILCQHYFRSLYLSKCTLSLDLTLGRVSNLWVSTSYVYTSEQIVPNFLYPHFQLEDLTHNQQIPALRKIIKTSNGSDLLLEPQNALNVDHLSGIIKNRGNSTVSEKLFSVYFKRISKIQFFMKY